MVSFRFYCCSVSYTLLNQSIQMSGTSDNSGRVGNVTKMDPFWFHLRFSQSLRFEDLVQRGKRQSDAVDSFIDRRTL